MEDGNETKRTFSSKEFTPFGNRLFCQAPGRSFFTDGGLQLATPENSLFVEVIKVCKDGDLKMYVDPGDMIYYIPGGLEPLKLSDGLFCQVAISTIMGIVKPNDIIEGSPLKLIK